ncbi:MAG: biotin--[acetyl-CoA-carboxylase] ligase, partial [Planctomycetota bacterium]|nr:biotin--[acetyl-CoA-carboxylase] ligase [Planctomycetota bacterium]
MSDHASATGRPIDQWPDALEASIAHCASWRSVTVLRETASTQDHARNLEVGSVVVAGRQTAGRGRLGRSWIDTAEDGLALSANIA